MNPHPWPVRCVVFDLDGLMIDSEPFFELAARQLLERRGRVLDPVVWRGLMGSPARDAIVKFHQGHALTETIAEIASEYRDTFLQALGSTTVPLLPGVLDLLERIERKGLPRAIATSSEAVYVERVLGPHRILHRFAFALTCDDVQHGKPHPEVYEKAAARLGCRPAEMVVLEDSVNGLRAAKAAGARCIVVPHAEVPRGELAGADAVVASLEAPLLRELLGLA